MALKFKGVAAAHGVAIAPLVHFHGDLGFIPQRTIGEDEIPAEKSRLEEAIVQAARSLLFLSRELERDLSDHDLKIYDAQLALLHDTTFKQDLFRTIEQERVNAETAIQRVVSRFEKVFESMEDAAMRERAADLRDVGRQMLSSLMERERSVYIADGRDYVFAAEEFLPSDAGVVDRRHLKGIVTARGGKVLARGDPRALARDPGGRRDRRGAQQGAERDHRDRRR